MGMNCDFQIKDKDQEEMMQMIVIHAEKSHNMKTPLPPDIQEKLNKAIKK